jgi:hypothetical protein
MRGWVIGYLACCWLMEGAGDGVSVALSAVVTVPETVLEVSNELAYVRCCRYK